MPTKNCSEKLKFTFFFTALTALTAQPAQTEEFIFQNVAYRPTVYRTGILVAIRKQQKYVFYQSIEIGAGISVGDMGQSNFLVSLVIAKMVFPSFIFGICMHSMIKSIFVPRHKNLMELLNSNLIGVLSVRKLIRKHCTVRSVKSNVRRVLPYLLF